MENNMKIDLIRGLVLVNLIRTVSPSILEGEVMMIGDSIFSLDGERVTAGNKILFKRSGNDLKLEDNFSYIINVSDVLAIVT